MISDSRPGEMSSPPRRNDETRVSSPRRIAVQLGQPGQDSHSSSSPGLFATVHRRSPKESRISSYTLRCKVTWRQGVYCRVRSFAIGAIASMGCRSKPSLDWR